MKASPFCEKTAMSRPPNKKKSALPPLPEGLGLAVPFAPEKNLPLAGLTILPEVWRKTAPRRNHRGH